MERVCYFVEASGENWIVWFDNPADAEFFSNRTSALEAARRSARTRWEAFRRPSCVRIKAGDNEWMDDALYGS